MFKVGGSYSNRIGKYTVLSIDGPLMSVKFEDGATAELRIAIQERIWENIVAEQEAKDKRLAKRSRRRVGPSVNHYVKVLNVAPSEELAFPGWEERVVMAPNEELAAKISKGDRLIYFSQEAMTYFAVATVTGDPFEADPKKYTFTTSEPTATFFQIDIDADTGTLDKGITFDSVELESNPELAPDSVKAETFIPISEDDFELLSELLTEVSEDEEEDEDLVDDEDDAVFEEDDE